MADVLKYGDKVHIKNGYNNWDGGYLDTCNHATAPNSLYGVVTATTPHRGPGTGTWVIESATGKAVGTEVESCDVILLWNLYKNEGGYLDTNGHATKPSIYNVVTALKESRPADTLHWRIFAETSNPKDFKVREGDVVHFLNGYNDVRGGFLDTCGHATGEGVKYAVSTTPYLNRDANTGLWKISKAND